MNIKKDNAQISPTMAAQAEGQKIKETKRPRRLMGKAQAAAISSLAGQGNSTCRCSRVVLKFWARKAGKSLA